MKKIQMFKNGRWVKWNGSDDVTQLLITEKITLKELKKRFPKIRLSYLNSKEVRE